MHFNVKFSYFDLLITNKYMVNVYDQTDGTLHTVDLWRYYVCCTSSEVTRYTFFMVLYLSRMCRCWCTQGALIAHRYTFAPPSCSIKQYGRTFIPVSISVERSWWPAFDGVVLAGFHYHFIGLPMLAPFLSPTIFPFSFFILWASIVGLGSSDWQSLSPSLALPTFLNNNDNNNLFQVRWLMLLFVVGQVLDVTVCCRSGAWCYCLL